MTRKSAPKHHHFMKIVCPRAGNYNYTVLFLPGVNNALEISTLQ